MKDEASQAVKNELLYAGRWVARVRGRIVAQGGTPEQALRACQQSRYKEKPEIIYMPTSFPLPPLVEKVKTSLPADQQIYLVGGAVRDILTGRLAPDLDFAVPSNGISMARKVANALQGDFVRLDDEHDIGRVIVTNEDGSRTFLDFAAYRGSDLEDDLRGRDFTVNALAYDLQTDSIIDPLDGMQDLRAGMIRTCSTTSFNDDPVRILRAVRQAAAFEFHIDKETRTLMMQAAGGLARVSVERLRDELFKTLEGPKPDASMRALEMLGVFPYFLPELAQLKGVDQSLPHVHDAWNHTLAVLESLETVLAVLDTDASNEKDTDIFMSMLASHLGGYLERFTDHFAGSLNTGRSLRSLLFFAAQYHDVSKPQTKSIDEKARTHFYEHEVFGAEVAVQRARALNLSNDEIDRLHRIVKHHMRIHSFAIRFEKDAKMPSRRAIYRFFRDAGEAGIDLALLVLADTRGMRGATLTEDVWKTYLDIARLLLENYWERPEEAVSPPRLLDGLELMKEFDLKPGPVVGRLLEAIRENQAAGSIETREQALAFARRELAKESTGKA
jgi:tRNA nucleotidyltransferase/poly(A) polymerase